jgi:serine/threonine-protein kinase
MPQSAGTRLGAYEIISLLGAGGMGEVYRAHDTRLARDVAVKILPDAFTHDPERLARFRREAQVLAALNHPHIGAIYGLDDAAGTHFLVLELVEGQTLADRIRRGALPLDEALSIARQIAEALEAAHEKSIIHRDLKPANIALTPDGAVKVLDFGLAKATEATCATPVDLANSPTITSPAMMTGIGMILGTAPYMSPEQAKGRPADKRSDVWAFGCLLYEMLTGACAFGGESVTETLAIVLQRDPDWDALPANVPNTIRVLITRCLTKDRAQRVPDVATIRFILAEHASFGPVVPIGAQSSWNRSTWWRRSIMAGCAGLMALASAGIATRLATGTKSARVARFALASVGGASVSIDGFDHDVAITPDGSRLVYVGNNGTRLFVRSLDALEPVLIASGEIRGPFVSPDGQWVGFCDNLSTLKRVAISGGPIVPIAGLDSPPRGATWLPDGTIVFATSNPATGLQRVPSAGGTPVVLTRPDPRKGEADHIWPRAVSGSNAVLLTVTKQSGGLDAADVELLDFPALTRTPLLHGGSDAQYVGDGTLVFVAAGTLRAVSLDRRNLRTQGAVVPVLSRLVTSIAGMGDYGVASDGTLAYLDAVGGAAARRLVWVDRAGREEAIEAPSRAYTHPRLSKDDSRVAVYIADQEADIWIWDLRRPTLRRLTFGSPTEQAPVWVPDDGRVMFASDREGGASNVWSQTVDGAGIAERLTSSSNGQYPTSVSPDGTRAVFMEFTPTMGRDLMEVALDGSHRVTSILKTPFNEQNGVISPDGRWLAYESDNSGAYEVYVRPFVDGPSGASQVSSSGGLRPSWARTGRDLFFLSGEGSLMHVAVEPGPAWNAGTPTKLFDASAYYAPRGGNIGRTYDVALSGDRFLMIKGDAQASLVVVQNWFDVLKAKLPAGK